MAKKISSKKYNKKNKTICNTKYKIKKILRLKNISIKKNINLFNTSPPSKNFGVSKKISKIFMDTYSAIKIQCFICNKNIINQIKIVLFPFPQKSKIFKKGLSFNALCFKCFLLKSEYNKKKNSYYISDELNSKNYEFNHYVILQKITKPLFTKNWSFIEEIKLLGAVEYYGLDNWEEISEFIGKGKFECEAHYYNFYYINKNNYLPNISKNSNKFGKNKQKENLLLTKIINSKTYNFFTDNKKNNKHFKSSKKNNNNLLKNSEKEKNELINQNALRTIGYWVKRNEFEIEYKNNAEIELSELEFSNDDTEEVRNKNFKILKNYNNILDEREERKKLIFEKNLYDIKKQFNFEKKLSQEDREIYNCLKYNLRFLQKEQFDYILESNILEKNLKSRLNQLIFYYKKGLRTFDDIQEYIDEISFVKEDEKMKLRNSNFNKENEKIVSEEDKLREELEMKKQKYNNIKNNVIQIIKERKK